jgi:hypothetical protein
MSSIFTTAAPPLRADPAKRVNYTLGLVLGVDEFQQDQLYHAAGRRWHNRLLHGYGTVWGLHVTTPDVGAADPELRVSEGVAVDPCGREICVPATMCVRLDPWLARHRPALEPFFDPAFGEPLPLALVLCHRECPDDVVPVPGEPCRSQDDAMQPSRIRDSFELRLMLRDEVSWDSPPGGDTGLSVFRLWQPEEEAVRAFGELLARVRTTTDPALAPAGRDELLAGVRALAAAAEPRPASPPGSEAVLLLAGEAADVLREALRVWVTEVRPAVRALQHAEARNGCGAEPCDQCVLLAELDLPVSEAGDTWQVAGLRFAASEENRPVLAHTRLLQEWLLCAGLHDEVATTLTFATVFATATNNLRAWVHHPALLDIPPEAVRILLDDVDLGSPSVVTRLAPDVNVFDLPLAAGLTDDARVEVHFDAAQITELASAPGTLLEALDLERFAYLDRQGDQLVAYTAYQQPGGGSGGVSAHGDLTGLDADDHPQYLLTDGTRALAGDLSADGHRITGLGAGTSAGDTVRFDQAIKVNDAATGDLAGSYPSPTVARLRGHLVATTQPGQGQVLTWNAAANHWQPQAPPQPAAPTNVVTTPAPGYSIVAAGFFRDDGTPRGPTFGNLQAQLLSSLGQFNLQFAGYQQPGTEDPFVFIIKGMAENPRPEGPPLVVEFVQFFQAHLRIRVVDAQGRFRPPFGFMVEISRFEVRR